MNFLFLNGPRFGLPPAFARAALGDLLPVILTALALAAGVSGAARADDAPRAAAAPGHAEVQAVAVTALRVPARVSDTVAEVTVLSRADLDRAAGLTLTELLARQPGLQFASNGGRGQSSQLFIRGLEARHTVLLLDGVRVGSATLGLPSLDNLPVALIDHIEIVRGPMSSLYGSDAAGGVVQVFTRRGAPGLAANAEASAGSRGYAQGRVGLRYGEGGFDAEIDLQHTRDRGFSATNPNVPFGAYNPDRDGFRQNAVAARFGWQLTPDWRIEGLTLDSSGQARYDDGPDGDARALLINRVHALKLSGHPGADWQTGLTASRSTDDYVTQASTSAYATLGTIATVQDQLSWENSLATPAGTLLAVLEATTQKVSQPGASYDVSQRDIDAAVLALDGQARGATWQASLRRDHNSQFGNPTTGALALAYALAPAWRIGASYGTSFVAPSFNQLYYPGYGNPALQPERGHTAELNLRWAEGADTLRAALYRSRIRGFITSGADATNVAQARIDGLTLDGQTQWHALTLQASIDHLAPRSDSPAAAGGSAQLPRRAKNAFKADATWSLEGGLVGADFAAWSRRYDDAANTVALGAYATLDLFGERALARDWTLAARMNNVGGKVYETTRGYDQAPREVVLTLRYAPR